MDIDFEDLPMLKIAIVLGLVIIIGGGLLYVKTHRKTVHQNAAAGLDYLFIKLPDTMTLQSGMTANPFIINSNKVRLPTDAKLIYVYGYHYVYSLNKSRKPIIFTSETINARYTGPNITSPIGVQYTAVGSNTTSGSYSNFWNFYYINGSYVGTVAINGAPSIVTTDQLPASIVSNFFNYGMGTAMITKINGTQILLVINKTNENGTQVLYGWWFMPDRIVFEKDYTVNGTTVEYTYYMQINAGQNQYMTLALSG